MELKVTEERGICVIAASGELDAAQAPELDALLARTLADGKHLIVVDMKGTRFVDSSGLATLVRGFKRARTASGNLALAGLQPPVRKVFELTRLDKAFDIFADSADAIRKMAK